jgi:hypothetical protein
MVAKTLVFAGAALLAAFSVAGPAAAQQRAAPRAGPDGSVIFNMLDKNGDGVIDKNEADAAAAAAFSAVDRNNDGRLSQAEVAAAVRDFAGRALGIFTPGQNGTRGPAVDNRRGGPQAPQWFYDRRGQDRRFAPNGGRGEPNNTPRFAQPNGPRFQQPPQGGNRTPSPGFNRRFGPQQGGPNGPGAQPQPNGPRFQQPPQGGNQTPFAPGFNRRSGPQQGGPNGPGAQPQPRNRGGVNPPQSVPQGPQAAPTPPTPPAQPNATPGPTPGNDGRTPAFNALDTNHDGVITPDEFNAARARPGPRAQGPLGQ